MDPLTHGILGATVSRLGVRQQKSIGLVALCGILGGMFPDLDIFFSRANDPMFNLAYHRHFTHALLFVPFGTLILASVLWLIIKRKLSFRIIYLSCFLGMLAHGPLDAMTNYGTHLFLPFTNRRESWNIISIIDPVFTLTLLILLILSIYKKSRSYVVAGGIFALLYWSAGYYQLQHATSAMYELANSRGHIVERHEVKPSFANLLAWRMMYQYQGEIYVDAVHVSPWKGKIFYPGSKVPIYTPPSNLPELQKRDLDYFTFFSDGWVSLSPTDSKLIADIRFAMLPNQIAPLWGVKLQTEFPDRHVLFEHKNRRTPADTQILWKIILGSTL